MVTPADFSTTADISLYCYWQDELYDFTNAQKKRYPSHFRDSFLRRHRLNHNSPRFAFCVAVTDEGESGHTEGGRVIGYAIWYRYGTSEQAQRRHKDTYSMSTNLAGCGRYDANRSLAPGIERTLLYLTDTYISLFHLDKSLDRTRRKQWLSNAEESFPAIPELWKLQDLCVHPEFQRRGIAGLLLDRGKGWAKEEGCPIGLSSSPKGEKLYAKAGFRRYGTISVKDFPVDDVPLFLWEPPGLEGVFGMKGDVVMGAHGI